MPGIWQVRRTSALGTLSCDLPSKYVINKMPMVGARMLPTGFLLVGLLQDGVGFTHRDQAELSRLHSRHQCRVFR